jgi:hypothetical protein
MVEESSPHRVTLNGWKEIAAYLGKSVRSVQRWESTLGLPVRRINTPDGHIVYANREEIDAWRRSLDGTPHAELHEAPASSPLVPDPATTEPLVTARVRRSQPWQRWPVTIAAVALFAAGAAFGRWQAQAADVPTAFRLVGGTLDALNERGVLLWQHRFDRDALIAKDRVRLQPQVVDLDGDGALEVLAFVRFAQPGRPATMSDGIFCFSAEGRLQWKVVPAQTLSFGGQDYGAPWEIQDVVVSAADKDRKVFVALAHQTWWPALVLEITAGGQSAVRYIQAGRIFALAHWPTPAGGMLAVGGLIAGNDRPSLALLQDSELPASYPGPGAGPYACDRCPSTLPHKLMLFDKSELALLTSNTHSYVGALTVRGGTDLRADIMETSTARAIAMFGPDLALDTLSFNDAYWRAHEQLEQSGRLAHSFDTCPERQRARLVQEWTAANGWRKFEAEADAAARQRAGVGSDSGPE